QLYRVFADPLVRIQRAADLLFKVAHHIGLHYHRGLSNLRFHQRVPLVIRLVHSYPGKTTNGLCPCPLTAHDKVHHPCRSLAWIVGHGPTPNFADDVCSTYLKILASIGENRNQNLGLCYLAAERWDKACE